MTHSSRFICGSMSLLLLSGPGCTGSGLKNMFSRNETAGYSTLEELEAQRAREEASAADGPKFASWMPFGKHSDEDAQDVASVDRAAETEQDSAERSWLKNPFRRHDTIEADPFLAGTDVAVTAKETTAKKELSRDSAIVAESDTLPGKPKLPGSVKTVSDSAESDDFLVDRFEQHFLQEAKAAAVDSSNASIVASRQQANSAMTNVAGKSADTESAAQEKLPELEQLLAEKKATAAKQLREQPGFLAEQDEMDESVDDFAALMNSANPSAPKTARSARQPSDKSGESFDHFLAAAQDQPKSHLRTQHAAEPVSQDIEVSDAASVFGSAAALEKNPPKADVSHELNDGWSRSPWSPARPVAAERTKLADSHAKVAAPAVPNSGSDPFAGMFSTRTHEPIPPAVLPDAPESDVQRSGEPIHLASSGRQISAEPETPAGLEQDSFFAADAEFGPMQTMPAESDMNTESDVSASTANTSTWTLRNWLLLLGGIIVVALLFAPGRKKPIHAHQLPAHG